jgi:hypothetical protein
MSESGQKRSIAGTLITPAEGPRADLPDADRFFWKVPKLLQKQFERAGEQD